ncbi:hypothetical protein Bbelb_207870 [Branchiostoma belcheri]|nr:hypothetical protein Bbelb_207870 [Branchiostoma belcheri]
MTTIRDKKRVQGNYPAYLRHLRENDVAQWIGEFAQNGPILIHEWLFNTSSCSIIEVLGERAAPSGALFWASASPKMPPYGSKRLLITSKRPNFAENWPYRWLLRNAKDRRTQIVADVNTRNKSCASENRCSDLPDKSSCLWELWIMGRRLPLPHLLKKDAPSFGANLPQQETSIITENTYISCKKPQPVSKVALLSDQEQEVLIGSVITTEKAVNKCAQSVWAGRPTDHGKAIDRFLSIQTEGALKSTHGVGIAWESGNGS